MGVFSQIIKILEIIQKGKIKDGMSLDDMKQFNDSKIRVSKLIITCKIKLFLN